MTSEVLRAFGEALKNPELRKEAAPMGMLAGLGSRVVGYGMRAANAMGKAPAAKKFVQGRLAKSPNFLRNVGIGTAATGAAGLAGAGYLASK